MSYRQSPPLCVVCVSNLPVDTTEREVLYLVHGFYGVIDVWLDRREDQPLLYVYFWSRQYAAEFGHWTMGQDVGGGAALQCHYAEVREFAWSVHPTETDRCVCVRGLVFQGNPQRCVEGPTQRTTLYVKPVPPEPSVALRDHFEACDGFLDLRLCPRHGSAFVDFDTPEHAAAVVQAHREPVCVIGLDKPVSVEYARKS